MSDLPPGLARLEQELFALGDDAMTIDELDGFIAGLLVCPDLVLPAEWLPMVWDGEPDEKSPFTDLDHLKRLFDPLMAHYNDVAVTLMERAGDYEPLLSFDDLEDRVIWELWAAGFARAVELRLEAWQHMRDADVATAAALRGLLALATAACSNSLPDEDTYLALDATAAADIARWVITLHEWRLARAPPPGLKPQAPFRAAPVRTATKVGRNEPCPCGSGKKYKKCCGLN